MTSLPTGTVTFLFTDIEGSTRLWESRQEAMEAALLRHNTLLKEAIECFGGQIFKTVGDAFCSVFTDAAAAIRAAVEGQRALDGDPWEGLEQPLRVRMAIHCGVVEARDGDYFGPVLNRVARLLSAGHGGQVLLSLAAEEVARRSLPEDVALFDQGEHRPERPPASRTHLPGRCSRSYS
jgi:class 3 adenylate cyclase